MHAVDPDHPRHDQSCTWPTVDSNDPDDSMDRGIPLTRYGLHEPEHHRVEVLGLRDEQLDVLPDGLLLGHASAVLALREGVDDGTGARDCGFDPLQAAPQPRRGQLGAAWPGLTPTTPGTPTTPWNQKTPT